MYKRQVFGITRIKALKADREFMGAPWFKWLSEQNINYVIRLKENGQYISNSRGRMIKAYDLFRPLAIGTQVNLSQRKVGKKGDTFDIVGVRNKKGELVVLIYSPNVKDPVEIYTQRWQIETMFKAFKSSGFDCESTHITDDLRLNTLIQVMSIAFCLAYQVGEIIALVEPQIVKKHGYKQKSIFRMGLDEITIILQNIIIKLKHWKRLLIRLFRSSTDKKYKIVM